MDKKYVIGLDYGTDSVRALLVDAENGAEVACAVSLYKRWAEGKYCDPEKSQFRQHPLDYIEGMEESIKEIVAQVSPAVVANILAITIDTTGSTPGAVDEKGTPLALTPGFEEDPDAMFVLWKDHTALKEADDINALAKQWGVDYTKYSGGLYSSEWFWSKILNITKKEGAVAQKAFSWMEHCDWMPAFLTGNDNVLTVKRSRCAAGHKAMWHEEFNGLPSQEFLGSLHPNLAGLRDRLYHDTYTTDEMVGNISAVWAQKLGLPESVKVGVGALDAHLGAVGTGIEAYSLVKVMGTSTCDMVVVPKQEFTGLVNGICGQVDGSVIPDMLGMEAGQSAFGDVYSWFKQILEFPMKEILADTLSKEQLKDASDAILPKLADKASQIPVTANDLIALDWINGRRTPDVDMTKKGLIAGITLGTTAPHLFKALVEATAFGSKAIMNRFIEQGVAIKQVIALGGISKKSTYVMQTLANILNVPIKVATSEQACALGSAMFAAVIGGVHQNIAEAQQKMTSGYDAEYLPEAEKAAVYEKLYQRYLTLGNQ
ncbi:ribulokinase [Pedobacter chitinilyticus]|uniref:Ribulokinase n=1 Tax=Pedobacter chitinilyticus TaxID=2233776 RepID=A0A443Z2A0_9SPHI|nr:ribulokinase [Pedobacter chitinilyticus]RWU10600.1 ribulokinase [Pedobacter chitinilyticus]